LEVFPLILHSIAAVIKGVLLSEHIGSNLSNIAVMHYQQGYMGLTKAYEQLLELATISDICMKSMRRGKNARRNQTRCAWARWNVPFNNSYWYNSPNPSGNLNAFRATLRMERATFDYIFK